MTLIDNMKIPDFEPTKRFAEHLASGKVLSFQVSKKIQVAQAAFLIERTKPGQLYIPVRNGDGEIEMMFLWVDN